MTDNYVSMCCTQLEMYLIENKMSSLSGRPQKIVVNILEEIVNHGSLQRENCHVYACVRVCKLWVCSELDTMSQSCQFISYCLTVYICAIVLF